MIEVEVLCETFGTVKEYVPAKDRQAMADHVFSVLTDMEGISEKDLKIFSACDPHLKKACDEYFEDDEIDEDNINDYEAD